MAPLTFELLSSVASRISKVFLWVDEDKWWFLNAMTRGEWRVFKGGYRAGGGRWIRFPCSGSEGTPPENTSKGNGSIRNFYFQCMTLIHRTSTYNVFRQLHKNNQTFMTFNYGNYIQSSTTETRIRYFFICNLCLFTQRRLVDLLRVHYQTV